MKLVKVHIENFGGLHDYDLNLEAGLTVVCQPNGFGKTTLAEFIRAMFYGFPRKGKTLEKSRRQKYTPWNGGKCGGNLVFEVGGERYRLERTFGTTPRGDTFNLIDLSTNKKSDRFSEEIGLELFKLDADSFERSTYLPQLRDIDSLTTDGIQAKLGDLVEDANDMGSFDKAMNALKAARSGYIPYRGSGGAVAEAQGNISRLQSELERTEGQRGLLEDAQNRIGTLEAELETAEAFREQIRGRILQASRAAALAAVHRERSRLEAEETDAERLLAELKERYPKGMPTQQQILDATDRARELAALPEDFGMEQADLEAAAFVEENAGRFENRLPTPEELEECREQIVRYEALRVEADKTGLSEAEQAQYQNLLQMAEAGLLTDERLERLEEKHRTLTRLRHGLESAGLPEASARRLETLETYFAPGIPEPEMLESLRAALTEAGNLREKNGQLTERLAAGQEKKRKPHTLVLLSLLALAALGAGVALMLYDRTPYGLAALGIGALALLLAVITGMTMAAETEKEKQRRSDLGAAMARNREKAEELETQASRLTQQYSRRNNPAEALYEIRENLRELEELTGQARTAQHRQQQTAQQMQSLEGELTRELGLGDPHKQLVRLRVDQQTLRDLKAEDALAREKIRELETRSGELRVQIESLLGAYFQEPNPADFHSLLSRLQHACESYQKSLARMEAYQQRKIRTEQKREACRSSIDSFFRDFGLLRQGDPVRQLEEIREDLRTCRREEIRLEAARRERMAYEADHMEELQTLPSAEPEALDSLQEQERQNGSRIEELTRQLLAQKQLCANIQTQLSAAPAIRDELEAWQEKWTGGKENARILDDTMAFLDKARENLQNSYLGPVRDKFREYMQELMGEDPERILLTPELEVTLERAGQARELGYFSAGQTDTVMLCMRLALVDALFTDVQPILILDDPFVNLDDERTAQALALLRRIGQKKQILYLSCNSSRT